MLYYYIIEGELDMIIEQRHNMEYNNHIDQLVKENCKIPEERRFYEVMKKYDIAISEVPSPIGVSCPQHIIFYGVVVIDFKNSIQKEFLFAYQMHQRQSVYNYYDFMRQEFIQKDYVKDISLVEDHCRYHDFVYQQYLLNNSITEDDFEYIFGRDILDNCMKRIGGLYEN